MTTAVGLTATEADIVGDLARCWFLWRIANHTSLVDLQLTSAELSLCDTDQRIRGEMASDGGCCRRSPTCSRMAAAAKTCGQ